MIKSSKPERPTVELRPSRIRRDPPPPAERVDRSLRAYPSERDTRTVVVGVILFAVALAIIVVGFSDFTSR